MNRVSSNDKCLALTCVVGSIATSLVVVICGLGVLLILSLRSSEDEIAQIEWADSPTGDVATEVPTPITLGLDPSHACG